DALLGRGARPLSNLAVYQQLLTQALWEGVQVVRAAGYREHRIGGMPPFGLLHLVAVLPGFLTRALFERRVGDMRMSSMTQDVVLGGAQDAELEPIPGCIVRLPAEHGVAVPYNRAIYRLGRERFRPGFEPLSPEEVLAAVDRERAGAAVA